MLNMLALPEDLRKAVLRSDKQNPRQPKSQRQSLCL